MVDIIRNNYQIDYLYGANVTSIKTQLFVQVGDLLHPEWRQKSETGVIALVNKKRL